MPDLYSKTHQACNSFWQIKTPIILRQDSSEDWEKLFVSKSELKRTIAETAQCCRWMGLRRRDRNIEKSKKKEWACAWKKYTGLHNRACLAVSKRVKWHHQGNKSFSKTKNKRAVILFYSSSYSMVSRLRDKGFQIRSASFKAHIWQGSRVMSIMHLRSSIQSWNTPLRSGSVYKTCGVERSVDQARFHFLCVCQ